MSRRFRVGFFAVWFAVASVLVPVRQAYAIVPVLVPLALDFIGAAGQIAAGNALRVAASSLLGGVAMALIFSTPGDSSQGIPAVPVRVPTTSNYQFTDAAMPPPFADSTAAPVGGGSGWAWSGHAGVYASLPAACTAYSTENGWDAPRFVCVDEYSNVCSTSSTYCDVYDTNTANYMGDFSGLAFETQGACPAGYSANGSGGCDLSDARAAVADGKADVTRGPNGYLMTDADASTASNMKVENGQLKVWGKDADGNPAVATVGVNQAGDTTIDIQRQVSSAGGQSMVKADNYIVNNATGKVTAVGSTTTQGTISLNPATSTPVVTTGAAVSPVEAAGSGTGTGSIVFPSDYARAGEAATAATRIISSLTDVPDVADPTVEAPTTDAIKDGFYGAEDKVTGLLGWQVPGHVSECPTASINWNYLFSAHWDFNGHCSIAETIRPTLAAVVDVLWMIAAFFIVLGA